MKNTVHCRGLMNCIFRVTLAFLMKVDEFPWAGQLCLNWCWLCQGTSMVKPRKNTNIPQTHKSSFGLSDNFSKNIWFKVWHLSSSGPGSFILLLPPPLLFTWYEHVCCWWNQFRKHLWYLSVAALSGIVGGDRAILFCMIILLNPSKIISLWAVYFLFVVIQRHVNKSCGFMEIMVKNNYHCF